MWELILMSYLITAKVGISIISFGLIMMQACWPVDEYPTPKYYALIRLALWVTFLYFVWR